MGKILSFTDEIVKLKFNDNEYTFWYKSKIVLHHIREFLKKNFPNDYILSEFNKIDFAVLSENLPVEIQSTMIGFGKKKSVKHSAFEQSIQKQIKQNIGIHKKCWFFFDSEFYRYLQNEITNGTRLNLDWFLQYIKEGSLQVFTINYKGKIEHLSYNDLSFLEKFENSDLEMRKSKILSHVLHGYGYTSEEIRKYYKKYKLSQDEGGFGVWLKKKGHSKKIKKLGYVLYVMTHLRKINEFFLMKKIEWNIITTFLSHIGILNYNRKHKLWLLEDCFDILQFFPGYIENKEFWDEIKGKKYKRKEFLELILNGEK